MERQDGEVGGQVRPAEQMFLWPNLEEATQAMLSTLNPVRFNQVLVVLFNEIKLFGRLSKNFKAQVT